MPSEGATGPGLGDEVSACRLRSVTTV